MRHEAGILIFPLKGFGFEKGKAEVNEEHIEKAASKISGVGLKKTILTFLAIVAVSTGFISISSGASAEQASSSKVIAYYFHGTFRCPSCHKLEQYAKEVIEADFKDALASGRLEFKVVNVEDKGNEHYVNDYRLYTKALVLSLTKDGKEIKSKNLEKIWEYVGNKQKYFDYVKSEVAGFLKEAQ
ncbi:MAG: nitrophenyl compound nitroreductase subunit ArsF family protein [Candidatus Omnitrophica bacterium]|nr:nitrophenyl compound nitroreductase subunit ArsF family protein [Candidatus Omnitrophota bacterium]